MKFFSIDSPLMQGLGKMADLMFLNILTLICCIPVVTVGAAWTALYYMTLKIVRDEEVYIARDYFKSFRQNFKQATVIWLIQLVVTAVLLVDFFLMFVEGSGFPLVLQVMLLLVVVIALTTFMFVYPLLSKFDNTIRDTIKKAFLVGVMQFPKVIAMVVLWAIPVVITLMAFQFFPLVLMFGMSLPAYVSSMMYNKFFKREEERTIERLREAGQLPADPGQEDEHIFSDALDPALEEKTPGSK